MASHEAVGGSLLHALIFRLLLTINVQLQKYEVTLVMNKRRQIGPKRGRGRTRKLAAS
jgi:hypothetical protein